MQTGTLTVVVTVTTRGGQLAHEAGVRVGSGAGVTEELSVAIGMTDSEVRVSQGVLLEEGAWAEDEGTTTAVVAGVGAVVGATASGVSVLVAIGITLSEVMVSQGVDEGDALEETAATLEGVTITGVDDGEGVTGVDEAETTGVTVACEVEAWAESEAWTDSMDFTMAMLEAIAALEGDEAGASELVAMGITLSEVMVSQGVDEGEALETAATLEGVTTTEDERGAGLEG